MHKNVLKLTRNAVLALPVALLSTGVVAKTLKGPYTISYLSGPSHTLSATQCLVFTNTGGIIGFPNSGTWVATTFSGFGGNFVVDGSDIRFYGTFGGGTGIIAHHGKGGKLIKGGFDDFTGTSGGATAANDGAITMTKGCDDARVLPRSGVSPTH
jgi:hypothetical protein